ncbi:MAG: antibiotic biosynthesis monooxygenase [Desulfobacterales bacterium]|nr:MAG: antibiotic biosynthesis monooxygenase [Desulfobacterales bacterium]
MPIRVLIKRQFKEGRVNEIKQMLKEIRYVALDQEGYMSSETMWDHENPSRVVVASNWRNIASWNEWMENEKRKSTEQKFAEFLEGKTEYEIFDLGFYPHY